jgi:hypothetical protein
MEKDGKLLFTVFFIRFIGLFKWPPLFQHKRGGYFCIGEWLYDRMDCSVSYNYFIDIKGM